MNNDKNKIGGANATALQLDLDEKWQLAEEVWSDEKDSVSCILMREGVSGMLWLSDVAEGTEWPYAFVMEGVNVRLSKELAFALMQRLRAGSVASDGQ